MDKIEIVVSGLSAMLVAFITLYIRARMKLNTRKRMDEERDQAVKAELRSIIDSIILVKTFYMNSTPYTNGVDRKLKELRDFFLRNEKLRIENKAFFIKWLGETPLGRDWTLEKAGELVKDLKELREANCQ